MNTDDRKIEKPATSASPVDATQALIQYRDLARRLVFLATREETGASACIAVRNYKQIVVGLEEEAEAIRSRESAIVTAKDELAEMNRSVQQREKEAADARKALDQLARPLGTAAFQGFRGKELTDLACFESRKALEAEIESIRNQQQQITASHTSGMIEKAKSMAQSTALAGRLLLAQARIGAADSAVGKALLKNNAEDSARCSATDNVLRGVAEGRSKIEATSKAVMDAVQSESQKEMAIAQNLQISAATAKELDDECSQCKARLLDVESRKCRARFALAEELSAPDSKYQDARLRNLVEQARNLRSMCAPSLAQAAVTKSFVIEDLQGILDLSYESAGEQIYSAKLWESDLSSLQAAVAATTSGNRNWHLKRLASTAFDKFSNDQNRPPEFHEIAALKASIDELRGSALFGSLGGRVRESVVANWQVPAAWQQNPVFIWLFRRYCFPLSLVVVFLTGAFAAYVSLNRITGHRKSESAVEGAATTGETALNVTHATPTPALPQQSIPPWAFDPDLESPTKPNTSSATTDDSTPINSIVKFPADYLGKTFRRRLWITADWIEKRSDGIWMMIAKDGSVRKDSAAQLGEYFLQDNNLNFLLTPEQAKQVSRLESGLWHNCRVVFTVEKRRFAGREYFVTAIGDIAP